MYGYSDDLFYCDGTDIKQGESDEIGCSDTWAAVKMWDAVFEVGCYVMAYYGVCVYPDGNVRNETRENADNTGQWAISISKIDEDADMPEWASNVKWDYNHPKHRYSPFLTFEVPVSVKVTMVAGDYGQGNFGD